MRWLATLSKLACSIGWGAVLAATPLAAQEDENVEIDPWAQLQFRLVQSDLDFDEGEDIDSSGFSLRARVGVDVEPSPSTRIRIEADASQYEYHDEDRDDRTSYGAAVQIAQDLSEEVEIRLRLRHVENVALLEASSADQSSASVRLQWQKGNDRVRVYADYRIRDYDLTAPANGEGWRVAAQYNRRIGSYHWLRFDLRHEKMNSDNSPRRNFERTVARVKYSLPIAKRVRVRPSLEYRSWSYSDRIARGDPQNDLRKDSYVAPGVEVTYGRSKGVYATASAQYRLRSSNDIRYDFDAVRVGVTVGVRF